MGWTTALSAILGSKRTQYVGLEDWKLYEKNYLAYLGAARAREAALGKLAREREALEQTRPAVFSGELNQFHEAHEALRSDSTDLTRFLNTISKFKSVAALFTSYPQLDALVTALREEDTFDSEEERRKNLRISHTQVRDARMSSKKARRRKRRNQDQERQGTGLSPVTIFILSIGVVMLLIVVVAVVFGDRSDRGERPWPGAVWSNQHGHWH